MSRDRRPNRDVVVGYCRPEDVDGCTYDSAWGLCLWDRDHDRRIHSTIGVEGGARVHLARNDIVRKFLAETDAPWLMWFDSDMVWPPDTIDALLAVADAKTRPIVGALCFAGGRTTIKPTIYRIARDDKGGISSDCALSYPQAALLEIDGTGCACLLTHRSVYEKMEAEPSFGLTPHPWFQDQVIDGKDFSEDIVFCLRAKTLGFPIWMHTGVKIGHRKKRIIDEATFIDFIAKVEAAHPDALAVADGEEALLTPAEFQALGASVL